MANPIVDALVGLVAGQVEQPGQVGQAFMTDVAPASGGLAATNYNHQFVNPRAEGGGLRTWLQRDKGGMPMRDAQGNVMYGGQMMPKTIGNMMQEIPRLGGQGSITEFSMGGNGQNEPFFPMVTDNMTPEMIKTLQLHEAGRLPRTDPAVQALERNAYEQFIQRRNAGRTPFMDYN